MKPSLAANTTLSHYRLLSQLGAGGMSEVYLAEDTSLNRQVAIKFLKEESVGDEQARKRLLREAKAAARLDHENICTVYEVGEEGGFIVMQYVEGETLAERMKRQPLEIKEALEIALQMAEGLSEAHAQGIIHRDIKPSNLKISERGQVKLMDFGLAKEVTPGQAVDSQAETESLLTGVGMIVGTLPYMSPEQVKCETLDSRTDIFSFGVVLYEMLSGHRLFTARTVAETISAILTADPPPLRNYVAELPVELERIVGKCLEKDRERRYQTVREVAIDLERVRRELESGAAVAPSEPETVKVEAAPTRAGWAPGVAHWPSEWR